VKGIQQASPLEQTSCLEGVKTTERLSCFKNLTLFTKNRFLYTHM
jgi:hypothetical protein